MADPTDFLLALICFSGVLVFGILVGLVIAVVVSLLALVLRAYRPTAAFSARHPRRSPTVPRCHGIEDHPEYETFPGLVVLRIDGELFFANARWFHETVRSLVRGQTPPVREVLVHAGAVPHLDTTAAAMLKELIAELDGSDVELDFARVTAPLFENLESNGIVELVGLDNFHETVAAGVADFLARDAIARRSGGATMLPEGPS